MNDDQSSPPEETAESKGDRLVSAAEEDKRIAARRRFLRVGTAGSTALIMTVAHKRAFAGKKASLASNCVSIQGTPDLKTAKQKKALELSAMGTPKGALCRPKPPAVDPNGISACSQINGSGPDSQKINGYKPSKYTDSTGKYYAVNDVGSGCGNIAITVQKSETYRLYEKGYCPLTWDGKNIGIDTTRKYYDARNPLVPINCDPGF